MASKYGKASRYEAPPFLPRYFWVLTWLLEYDSRIQRDFFVPESDDDKIPSKLEEAIDDLDERGASYRIARYMYPGDEHPTLFESTPHKYDNFHETEDPRHGGHRRCYSYPRYSSKIERG